MVYIFGALFVLGILYWVLWNRAKVGMITLLISSGAHKRRTMDISDLLSPPPDELQSSIKTLSKLGFGRLGEVQVKIPGVQIAPGRIFVSSEKTVFAELTDPKNKIIMFTTVFADDAVVETGFPFGEKIDSPNFRSHTITTDMEKAYLHHVEQVADFAKTHGIPRKIENMQDYLSWDAMYRRRYIRRKMRRNTWLGLLEVLALGYGVVALLAAIYFWLGSDKSTIEPLVDILFLLVMALAPAAILAFIIPFISYWGGRREPKSA